MNRKRKGFVTSLILLGMLTLIFAVLAFAEKTQDDGHLPERNGRGSGEMTFMIIATGLAGSLIPAIWASLGDGRSHSGQPALPYTMGMRC